MKLCERVAIISKKNMKRLKRLYGTIDVDDLSRIVNNHLEVAIEEIEEDCMHTACNNTDLMQMNAKALFKQAGKGIEERTYAVQRIRMERYCIRRNNCLQ